MGGDVECNQCLENMALIRQSRPDPGLGVQVKVLKTFELFHFRSEAMA